MRAGGIAENRLRECTAESMIAAMVAAGLNAHESRVAVTEIEHDPIFLAARRHQELLRKFESVMANQQRLWESAPNYAAVEKRGAIADAEFIERYVRGSRGTGLPCGVGRRTT